MLTGNCFHSWWREIPLFKFRMYELLILVVVWPFGKFTRMYSCAARGFPHLKCDQQTVPTSSQEVVPFKTIIKTIITWSHLLLLLRLTVWHLFDYSVTPGTKTCQLIRQVSPCPTACLLSTEVQWMGKTRRTRQGTERESKSINKRMKTRCQREMRG